MTEGAPNRRPADQRGLQPWSALEPAGYPREGLAMLARDPRAQPEEAGPQASETGVAERSATLCDGMAHAELDQDRRALMASPVDMLAYRGAAYTTAAASLLAAFQKDAT